jgi:hypothetical protein
MSRSKAKSDADGKRHLTPLDGSYENLLYKMQLTKGARYQSARRHRKRSRASIWSIVVLSLYVFATSADQQILDCLAGPPRLSQPTRLPSASTIISPSSLNSGPGGSLSSRSRTFSEGRHSFTPFGLHTMGRLTKTGAPEWLQGWLHRIRKGLADQVPRLATLWF